MNRAPDIQMLKSSIKSGCGLPKSVQEGPQQASLIFSQYEIEKKIKIKIKITGAFSCKNGGGSGLGIHLSKNFHFASDP